MRTCWDQQTCKWKQLSQCSSFRTFTFKMMSCEQANCFQLEIMECVKVDVNLVIWVCVDKDKCVSGYGYWTVRVGVGLSLSERLPTYLYQRESGPNVVRNVENVLWVWDRALVKAAYVPPSQRIKSERSSKYGNCVNSCLEVQSVCVDLLCGREKLYVCTCVDFLLEGAKLYGCEPFVW